MEQRSIEVWAWILCRQQIIHEPIKLLKILNLNNQFFYFISENSKQKMISLHLLKDKG